MTLAAGSPSPDTSLPQALGRRPSLVLRRHRSRTAARQRAAARTRKPLTPEQRAARVPVRRGPFARLTQVVGAVLGSAAAHAAVVGVGLGIAAFGLDPSGSAPGPLSIAVVEHEAPKPPPPPPKDVLEPLSRPELTAPRPTPRARAPEPQTEPQPVENAPPMRVVGLSLESTVEGSGGPAFAVGATRMGKTLDSAATPRKAVESTAPVATAPTQARAASPNRQATRIPTARAEMTLPKRRRPVSPPYPPELRAQGLEASVTVMVSIDETGRVTSVKILTPSPYPAFNEAAHTAALREQFEPAKRDGVPMPYTLSYTYRFRIED